MSVVAIPCKPKIYKELCYSGMILGGVAYVRLDPNQKWSYETTKGVIHVWRGSTHLYLPEGIFVVYFTSDDPGYEHIKNRN